MEQAIISVSELNNYIKKTLDFDVQLQNICVYGELSNYKEYPSGHHYFTLKDSETSIRCVLFRGNAARLRFRPQNGIGVIIFGRVTVYPRDGTYQLYVNEMLPRGRGDLYVAYEQLKEKLSSEGLFNEAHKKAPPSYPSVIAVITSGVGAAVQDIIRVAGQRWPLSKIIVLPVHVQGEEAPMEIVDAIKYTNHWKLADVIICGRGGGSIEDLWAFNNEFVAHAIYDSRIPIITAIGHEPDVTIADYVSDMRAATPSNGAELAVPDQNDIHKLILSYSTRCFHAINKQLIICRQNLNNLSSRKVIQSPMGYIDYKRMELDKVSKCLLSTQERMLSGIKQRFAKLVASLDMLSPLSVLSRGYAIAYSKDGNIIRKISDVSIGDSINVSISDGELCCTVENRKDQIKNDK